MKARVMNIMQYVRHPQSGAVLLTEDKIKDALAHRSIKQWAYILHDKDPVPPKTPEEAQDAPRLKPPHWHIVIQCANAVPIDSVAKWFGIEPQYVEVPKGQGAFLDCVQYLTHEAEEQARAGKHRYDDAEVHANFDFRKEVDALIERRAKYGGAAARQSAKRMYRHLIYTGKMTLRELCADNPEVYEEDYRTLDTLRMKYISTQAPMPSTRINYYVCGKGGIGKGLICKALARALYPDIKDDEDIFFEVGAKGVPFEGYDGQPVVIWNDRRAIDLLMELGGRENVFNLFDTHPTRQSQNVKYSSVCLINAVNIVNSVESYKEFLDGLAGQYVDKYGNAMQAEDKSQSYRRFPFIIPIHESDFDLLMNRGVFEGTRDYQAYIEVQGIQGNMQHIAEACGDNKALERRIESKTVKPVIDAHAKLLDTAAAKQKSEAEVEAMFADYGTVKGGADSGKK